MRVAGCSPLLLRCCTCAQRDNAERQPRRRAADLFPLAKRSFPGRNRQLPAGVTLFLVQKTCWRRNRVSERLGRSAAQAKALFLALLTHLPQEKAFSSVQRVASASNRLSPPQKDSCPLELTFSQAQWLTCGPGKAFGAAYRRRDPAEGEGLHASSAKASLAGNLPTSESATGASVSHHNAARAAAGACRLCALQPLFDSISR
jgi:hypothetical protein